MPPKKALRQSTTFKANLFSRKTCRSVAGPSFRCVALYWHSHSAVDWKPNHWSIFFWPRHLFSKDNSWASMRSSQSHYPKLFIQVEVADDADYFLALSFSLSLDISRSFCLSISLSCSFSVSLSFSLSLFHSFSFSLSVFFMLFLCLSLPLMVSPMRFSFLLSFSLSLALFLYLTCSLYLSLPCYFFFSLSYLFLGCLSFTIFLKSHSFNCPGTLCHS